MKTTSWFAFVLCWAAASGCRLADEPERETGAQNPAENATDPNLRGEDLYADHCSVCHGSRGLGDGPAAPFLFPPARRFDSGHFRIVSAENGAPFDRDLVATLRYGIPGSAMPAWGWLATEDLEALAAHVRELAIEGSSHDLTERARTTGDALSPAEARRLATEKMTPDHAIVAAAESQSDPDSFARGRRVFLERCAQCHAEDGTGQRAPLSNEDGSPNWARDFTAGFLKGGDSRLALTCRIRAGIPGSAMPPNRLEAADESALVTYVQSLIPKGVADRLVHMRSTLTARRVDVVPFELDDGVWRSAPAIRIVLAPLWWNEAAVLEASLSALHDTETVVFRLSWDDATGDVRLFGDSVESDAAALQISGAKQPALFGMGAPHEPTNLWHWRALRVEDVEGALDLIDPFGHAGQPPPLGAVRADVPQYQRLLGKLEPADRADRITVRGVGTLAGTTRVAGEVEADAYWQAGRWHVEFRRALRPEGVGSVPILPGSTLQVACAIWNSAAGDEGARKSISIWQELRIGL